MTSFAELGVPTAVTSALTGLSITEPFPIQIKTLPDSMSGKDVLGRGQTGSGKTLAFSIPLVTRLSEGKAAGEGHDAGARRRRARMPRGLVLAPTRELATQIDRTVAPLAEAMGLKTTVIYGGVPQKRQEVAIENGVDIVIACPGRLEDLMKQGIINLNSIELSVLDEADHMADMGFLPVVRRIMDATPGGTQRLLFSATLDNGVDKLVTRYMNAPVSHSVDAPKAAVTTMEHRVLLAADATAKKAVIQELATGAGRRVLFTRTKHAAKKLAKVLTNAGIPAVDLHGNLSQNARDRNLAEFSSGEVKVLVATDVAARGVHVDDVELVVHVDPPAEHKAYLHRSGRTARAGAEGTVVTLVLPEQRSEVSKLLRAAGVKAEFEKVSAGDATLAELIGDKAEMVDPQIRAAAIAAKSPARGGGKSTGANAQRKRAARSGGARSAGTAEPRSRRGASTHDAGSRGGAGTRTEEGGRGRREGSREGARSGGRDGGRDFGRDSNRAPREGSREGNRGQRDGGRDGSRSAGGRGGEAKASTSRGRSTRAGQDAPRQGSSRGRGQGESGSRRGSTQRFGR